MVGPVGVGGSNPIRVQSMITCDTMDTEASIAQTIELAAGRLRNRAHHRADGERCGQLATHRQRDCAPAAATCRSLPTSISNRKPRWKLPNGSTKSGSTRAITPTRRSSRSSNTPTSNTPPSWKRIRERFTPLVGLCQERGIAMRIGTNHGSLSDRIMNRYGDTPLGMVESALEFARIARDLDYHALIFSMKSSNPKVMIAAYRLLVARLARGRAGLELSHPSRRHRSRRRRRRADQKRDRHRLASSRWHWRHDSGFVNRRQHSRNSGRADADRDCQRREMRSQSACAESATAFRSIRFPINGGATRSRVIAGIGDQGREIALGGEETVRVAIRQAELRKDRAQSRSHGRLQTGIRLRKLRCRRGRSAR